MNIVDPGDLPKGGNNDKKSEGSSAAFKEDPSQHNPEKVSVPFQGMPYGETCKVHMEFMQNLQFENGQQFGAVPITLPDQLLRCCGKPLSELIQIEVAIRSGLANTQWKCPSHPLVVVKDDGYQLSIRGGSGMQYSNSDLRVGQYGWVPKLSGFQVKQKNMNGKGESFCAFLSPPAYANDGNYFGRNFVFLIDRSGSMTGKPLELAKKAVETSLDSLCANDQFSIVGYDHSKIWFFLGAEGYMSDASTSSNCEKMPPLCPVTPANVKQARNWLSGLSTRGTTDIFTPLKKSIKMLQKCGQGKLNVVMLVTDGCVDNEKAIVQQVKDKAGPVRVFTLGIGPYCNKYFLKMMAMQGRGYNDHTLSTENIATKIKSLVGKTYAPKLQDIELSSKKSISVYPEQLPDLYSGCPLIICGSSEKELQSLSLTAKDSFMNQVNIDLTPDNKMDNFPVEYLTAQQKLETLVGLSWLTDDKKYTKEATELSLKWNLPCIFTQSICVPQKGQFAAETGGGIRPVDPKAKKDKAKKGGKAGYVVLGVAVVAAVAFGSIMASQNNIGVGNVMGAMGAGNFGGLPDVNFEMPNFLDGLSLPEIPSFDMQMPDLSMPDFQMPNMQVPDFDMNVNMPDNLEAPDVDAEGLCSCLGEIGESCGEVCSSLLQVFR